MYRQIKTYNFSFISLLLICALLLLPALTCTAQEQSAEATSDSEAATEKAEGSSDEDAASSEEGAESEEGDSEESEEPKSDKVAVNLNNVKIDQVIKFLSEITGKFVIKQKDVNAQIMVYTPTEVSKEQAFALICEALLMEKVAVVETEDTIKLIPVDKLSEMVIDLMPEGSEKLGAGVIKKIIPIRFTPVEEIEKLIQPLISKTGSILAHPGSKKIIVTDDANRVQNIEDVIAQIDVLSTDQRQVQIFTLEHANAEEIAPLLKSVLAVLAKKNGAAPAAKPGQPQRPPQPSSKGKPPQAGGGELEVVAYKAANWLIVVAPKEFIAAAISLVEELDRERPPELTLRVLPIQFADADDMARELDSLFRQRPEKRLKETIEIEAHERSSSLMILSSEENFKLIKDIVVQLDTEESVRMTTETYPLVHADAEDIASQMTDLYSATRQSSSRYTYNFYSSSRNSDETRFVAETRTNSVIAIARPNEFDEIGKMIAKLDVPINAEEAAPRIFRLKYVDAKEMTDVLNEVFGIEDSSSSNSGYYSYYYGGYDDDDSGVGRLYGKVKFVPETTTNSIIVTTNNVDNFKIIDSFIKELDKFNPDAANTMVVQLENAKAEEIAEQLNALFAQEGARAPQKNEGEQQRSSYLSWLYGSGQKKDERAISNLIGQVRVVPDIRTNSLTITTAVQNFELIKELIGKLDAESPKVLVRVRLIEVTTTRASRIGTRFASEANPFETDDIDNGLRSTFGFGWQEIRGSGTLNAGINIGLLIQFLQRNVDTRILAEPTLVMNNNEPADLFFGSEIPFIQDSQTTPQGALNQSFDYKPAGITLKITPNINQLDKVVMKIELESSQVRQGEVLFGGLLLDTRKFNTEVAVKSGATIVIGGIMRETESEVIRRVPIIGRVPILNLAFRKKDKKRETTELIAFITATVIRDSDADAKITSETAEQLSIIEAWRPLKDMGKKTQE